MPIYEYRCNACGNSFEVLSRTRDDGPECNECESTDLERLISIHNVGGVHYNRPAGLTCCGKEERCDTPPCDTGSPCCKE